MKNVTSEVRNPFGMRPPCEHRCTGDGDRRAVLGYGDANADFHVVGDHPGVHGGRRRGVPFTDHEAGERVLDVLETVGFLERGDGEEPAIDNCFLSYLYGCCLPPGEEPTPGQYADYERFFDAELRAIVADVLVPVGPRATERVVREYTARAHRLDFDMERLHGEQLRGRGFLVVPLRDPSEWGDDGREAAVDALRRVLALDYRQTVDLGRFDPGEEPYFVR